jgi:hypothetical protein
MLSYCFHCIVLLIDLWCIEKTLVFQGVRKGCANMHRTCMHNTLIVHSCTPHLFTLAHPICIALCIAPRSCLHMPSHAFTCLHMPSHAFTDHAFTSPIMPSHVFTDHAFTCLHRSCLHMSSPIMPSHVFTDHAFTCLHMPSHLHSIVQHTPAKPCASPSLTFSIAFYIFSIVCRFAVLTSCKPKSLPIGHDPNNTDTHTRNRKNDEHEHSRCGQAGPVTDHNKGKL